MLKMQLEIGMMEGLAFGFLIMCALFDMKKKEIPVILIISGMAAATSIDIWQIINGTLSIGEAGYAMLPGIFFLFLSFCTKEKVGYGDGLLLLITGLLTGFYQCCLSLCISLVCTSIFALCLLLFHKARKDSSMPFVPFLVVGLGVSFFV